MTVSQRYAGATAPRMADQGVSIVALGALAYVRIPVGGPAADDRADAPCLRRHRESILLPEPGVGPGELPWVALAGGGLIASGVTVGA